MAEEPTQNAAGANDLQFDKAEYATAAGRTAACSACHKAIGGVYYEVNGSAVCEPCHNGLRQALTGGSRLRRFVRATTFGLGAAAVGAGIYYAVLALTGYEFGLVAIVVGLFVGAAVRKGCAARGGWLYQLLAMFLTYCAIVVTYMPLVAKAIREQAAQQAPAAKADAQQAPANEADKEDPGAPEERPSRNPLWLLVALVILFIFAFLTPILTIMSGNIMGLIIIGIALYEAWKINQRPRFEISGPYQLAAAGAPVPPPQGTPDHG